MSTFDAANYYFSGQGVVMIAAKDPVTGLAKGYRPVGNCSALTLTVATTVVDHKGAQDGQRAIDARLQTETKPTLSMTIDNWEAANLAAALRGNSTAIPAGAVTAELVNGFPGLVSGLQYTNISSLVVSGPGPVVLTPYTNDETPYDYKENAAAGSVELNDGSVVAPANLSVAATAIDVGVTTEVVVPVPAGSAVGDEVYLYGFTGADAALVNGQTVAIATIGGGGANITVPINTATKTITLGAGKVFFLGQPVALSVAYSYGPQQLTDALTQPLTSICMRFEGLNTAETNDPVIIEVFKFSTDPLKELAMISDTFGSMQLEGELLSDPTRSSGSKYFHIKSLK
jgi:hypothetical protein